MTAVAGPAVTRATEPAALASETPAGRGTAWWGMVLLIVTEVTLFAVLLASYFYVQFTSTGGWPLGGIEKPKLPHPLIMTGLLLTSSASMAWADHAIRHDQRRRLGFALVATMVLGGAFLGFQAVEYHTKLAEFTWTTNAYGSLFYTITGFHGFHVAVGLGMLAFTLVGVLTGRYSRRHHERVRLVSLYWHAIDGLWLFILASLYLSPHL